MPAYDHGLKEIAHLAGQGLTRIAGLECTDWTPLESTLQATTERLADRAFRAKVGKDPCVIYMEFVTQWDEDALWSFLAKSALLSERERLPTKFLVFILRKEGHQTHNDSWTLTVDGQSTQQLWFHEIPLWEVVPEDWWVSTPYLMPLFPLCKHGMAEGEAIRHAVEVIQENVASRSELADLFTLLGIFGQLASPGFRINKMIDSELLKESQFLQEMTEILVNDALREERIEALNEVLELKFPDADRSQVEKQLATITDSDFLKSLHRVAVTCKTLDEFKKQAKPKTKKKK